MKNGLIRGVAQVDKKGCGIAVVATVTGRRYEQVRACALQTGDWRASYGMNGGMLRRLLARLKWPVLSVTMGREAGRLSLAIVKVTGEVRENKRRWRHWVVWHRGTVWDPSYGLLWDGNGAVDGMQLYLASTKPYVNGAKTGRWHWL